MELHESSRQKKEHLVFKLTLTVKLIESLAIKTSQMELSG